MKNNNPPLFYYHRTFRWEMRMNQIESLAEYLKDRSIGLVCNITPPKDEGGFWQLDAILKDRAVNLTWKEGHGFDLSIFIDEETEMSNCGLGYDEHIDDVDTALQRVSDILMK